MSSEDDRRTSPRSPIEETLFIESISSSQISKLDESKANTVNASLGGLQVMLDFPVLEEAEIALWINGSDGERSLISGIVRWVNSQGEDHYLVGIELDSASGKVVGRWLDETN